MSLIGLELGADFSRFCVVDESGRKLEEGSVRSSESALRQEFGALPPCTIAVQFDIYSLWALELLTDLGHTLLISGELPDSVRQTFLPMVERMAFHTQQLDGTERAENRQTIVFRQDGSLFVITLENIGTQPIVSEASYFIGPIDSNTDVASAEQLVIRAVREASEAHVTARAQANRLHRLCAMGEIRKPAGTARTARPATFAAA